MDRSQGFGSAPCDSNAHFGLGFPTATPHGLTLPHSATRGLIMQKAPGHTGLRLSAPGACKQAVSGTISLPLSGCFSPFPHGTGALSVTEEYLGLEGGPPMFRQDFTCPALLEDCFRFTHTGLSPTVVRLSRRFRLCRSSHWPGPRSLATTSGVSVDVLSSGYLDVSVRRVRLPHLWIQCGIPFRVGCPIRKFTDQNLLAVPRDLSQRATSFIASQCQGIHQMPFRRLISRKRRLMRHAQEQTRS